ncbi:DUF4283 domain-containing protein [Abeliophyllum distichum]|uniref:DUF4283 domain-containing protein n=1 Tax=Abeliophyllum distichum TaxID=126358 RepID=A0ABD1RUK2_9LAMI
MQVLKYTFDFDPQKESHIVPVWIALPKIHLVFYDKAILLSIISVIGTPLKLDENAAKKSRTNLARDWIGLELAMRNLQYGKTFIMKTCLYIVHSVNTWCHEIEKCFSKQTTGSKAKINMDGEGLKINQDKKKEKAVWVEKQIDKVSNELEEKAKGDFEKETETIEHAPLDNSDEGQVVTHTGNNSKHNGVRMNATRIIKRTHHLVESIIKAGIIHADKKRVTHPVAVTWKKPKDRWSKLNIDGALKDCGLAAGVE